MPVSPRSSVTAVVSPRNGCLIRVQQLRELRLRAARIVAQRVNQIDFGRADACVTHVSSTSFSASRAILVILRSVISIEILRLQFDVSTSLYVHLSCIAHYTKESTLFAKKRKKQQKILRKVKVNRKPRA